MSSRFIVILETLRTAVHIFNWFQRNSLKDDILEEVWFGTPAMTIFTHLWIQIICSHPERAEEQMDVESIKGIFLWVW